MELCIMDFVICAATEFELLPFKEIFLPQLVNVNLHFLHHGIGSVIASSILSENMSTKGNSFYIQIGIAGCFTQKFALGDVVAISNEYDGSIGVFENERFMNLHEMQLLAYQPDIFSKNDIYANDNLNNIKNHLPLNVSVVNGVTVQEVSTSNDKIIYFKERQFDIETMEGASFHYNGNKHQKYYLQLRGISNYVGERNKKNWHIEKAINNVSEATFHFINNYSKTLDV